MASRSFFIFLLVLLFVLSLSIILFELALTRIFSIVLWYDYAFMAISIAFFGLGIGSFVIHIQKDKYNTLKKKSIIGPQLTFSSRIVQYALAYGISVPVFIFLIGYIPSDTSYIYLFYLISSIPFFFAGAGMALVFLAMSEKINKLYFADLIGAGVSYNHFGSNNAINWRRIRSFINICCRCWRLHLQLLFFCITKGYKRSERRRRNFILSCSAKCRNRKKRSRSETAE